MKWFAKKRLEISVKGRSKNREKFAIKNLSHLDINNRFRNAAVYRYPAKIQRNSILYKSFLKRGKKNAILAKDLLIIVNEKQKSVLKFNEDTDN